MLKEKLDIFIKNNLVAVQTPYCEEEQMIIPKRKSINTNLYKEKNSLEDISKKLNMDEDIVRRYIDNNYSIPERSQKTDNRGLEEEK